MPGRPASSNVFDLMTSRERGSCNKELFVKMKLKTIVLYSCAVSYAFAATKHATIECLEVDSTATYG